MQPFRSCTPPLNATESRRSPWLGRSSISPVAARNPLKHSAPLNRPHATNGGSCSCHPACRPVDHQYENIGEGLKNPGAQGFLGLHDLDGRRYLLKGPMLAIIAIVAAVRDCAAVDPWPLRHQRPISMSGPQP